MIKGVRKKTSLFFAVQKGSLTLPMLLGVKEKILGIDSKKILRPVPGLYSEYFPSYAISCDSQIFFSFLFASKTRLKIGCLKIRVSQKMS